jgi:hypothetical protein
MHDNKVSNESGAKYSVKDHNSPRIEFIYKEIKNIAYAIPFL